MSKKTTLIVSAHQPGAAIAPTMWGIFFEDINFGGDGGLYGELIKNGSFEFPDNLMGWLRLMESGSAGYMYIKDYSGNSNNAHYLHLQVKAIGEGYGITNEGYRGIGLREGADYRFSLHARQTEGDPITLRVEVVDADGKVLMKDTISGFDQDWQTHTLNLTAQATEPKAKLILWVESGNGLLDIDLVSMFPTDTWKGRERGLRKDLVQFLADMKPGFLRFPGGCIVEGRTLERRYQWKTTVGDPVQRKLLVNRWNTEFGHRITQDYYQSFGIGFYEYFLLSEDLGAEPMPIINCGMACQFNTAELVPVKELGPYIQDALDLIEFAKGPVDSEWGKLRADMGHPEPFKLNYLGVGNEQWGPQYIERYIPFAKALKEKHPEIKLIAGTGSDATIFPNGQDEINYLWEQYRNMENIDIVDEHFYRTPEWFLENTGFYDNYDPNGPEVFIGEYGAQSVGVASPDNRNNWQCALYEAAFMTGMERNAAVVTMSCYAPILAHIEAWQWTPDMIWFDNLSAYGTPNYYVQKLFSLNPGTHVLPNRVNNTPMLNEKASALNISTTIDQDAKEIIVKAVNASDQPLTSTIDLQGVEVGDSMKVITLSSASLSDENSLDEPEKIAPLEASATLPGASFDHDFPPYSLTILRIPVE